MDWRLGSRMTLSLFGSSFLVCVSLFLLVTAIDSSTPITLDRRTTFGVSVVSGVVLQSGGAYWLFYNTSDDAGGNRLSAEQAIARRLAQGMDMPAPTVIIRYGERPNAESMALPGVGHRIVLTSALVESLSRQQLACVIAHELAHVKNRDAAVMSVAAVPAVAFGTLATFGSYVRRGGDWWFLTPGGLVVAALQVLGVFGWVLARVCVGSLSRYRELAADRAAVRVTGQPATYATTLRDVGTGSSTPDRDLRQQYLASRELRFVAVSSPSVVNEAADDWEGQPIVPPEEMFDWDRVPILRTLVASHPPLATRVAAVAETVE